MTICMLKERNHGQGRNGKYGNERGKLHRKRLESRMKDLGIWAIGRGIHFEQEKHLFFRKA